MRRPAANNLTENEMREAIKLEAKIFEDETKPHMNRYSRVQSLIAKELLEGKLQARLRPEWGGEFSDILEPAIWNTERSIKTRFINCMLCRYVGPCGTQPLIFCLEKEDVSNEQGPTRDTPQTSYS